MPNNPNAGTRAGFAVSAGMIALCAAVLMSLYTVHDWPTALAFVAFAIFVIAGHRLYGRREQFLLVLAAGLTIAVAFWTQGATGLLLSAFERAVFLAAFMILLALLREGAVTSPSVLQVGAYLTRQRPGRRYLSIHLGGHLLAILLNFGALNLLGPLIMRGIKAGAVDPRIAEIRLQRQISALSRGFSWMVAWSPTTITQALVFAVVPGIDPVRMITLGLVLVALTTLAGWALDRRVGIRARRAIPPAARPQSGGGDGFPGQAFLLFSIVCLCLAGTTAAIILVAGVTTIPALMLAAPAVTVAWIVMQNAGRTDRTARLLDRLKSVAGKSMPLGSPEAVTLASAGYCGICAAGLVEPHWFAEFFGLAGWHAFAIYAAAMLVPPALSNIGLPPMMVVTFFGTLLSALPGLDFDPTLLGMAFCVGWALNLTGSPFGVSAIILTRITGVPGRRLTWRWNGWFSLVSFAISSLVLAAFSNF